jgi:hypothetical protein
MLKFKWKRISSFEGMNSTAKTPPRMNAVKNYECLKGVKKVKGLAKQHLQEGKNLGK